MSEIEGRVKYLPDKEKKETFGVDEDRPKNRAKKPKDDASLADKVKYAAHEVQKKLAS